MKRLLYWITPCLLLPMAGCSATSVIASQRFVLVNDPTGISDKIPSSALALDTRTGQLCYTLPGDFTNSRPLPLCSDLARKNP